MKGPGSAPHALDALVANAARRVAKAARVAELDVARLVALRPALVTEFHAMGVLLGRLREARLAPALGRRDLYELAAVRAGLGRRDVADLVAIAHAFDAREARELGWRLAAAFASLARGAGTSRVARKGGAFRLYQRGLDRSSGAALGPRERRVRVVLAAAKILRHERGEARGGRTTTASERAAAAALGARLRAAGHAARVEALATRPGQPATFRILDLGAAAVALLTHALRDRAR